MHCIFALIVAFAVAAALSGTPAPHFHQVAPLCNNNVADTDSDTLVFGGEAVLWLGNSTASSPGPLYVTVSGYGALSDSDASGLGATRTWPLGVVATRAATLSRDGATLYVWVGFVDAPSTYAVAGVDVATLDLVLAGTPLDFSLYDINIETLLSATHHPTLRAVLAGTARVFGAMTSPFVLAYSLDTDTISLAASFDNFSFDGIVTFDCTNATVPALVYTPWDDSVVLGLDHFAEPQIIIAALPTLLVRPPMTGILDASFSTFTVGSLHVADPSAAGPIRFAYAAQPIASNERFHFYSYPVVFVTNGPVYQYGEIAVFSDFSQPVGGLTSSVAYNIVSTSIYGGAGVWDANQTSLFRMLHGEGIERSMLARYWIPDDVDPTQLPPFQYHTAFGATLDDKVGGGAISVSNFTEWNARVRAAARPANVSSSSISLRGGRDSVPLRQMLAWRSATSAGDAFSLVPNPRRAAAAAATAPNKPTPDERAAAARALLGIGSTNKRIVNGFTVASIEEAPHACHVLTPFLNICSCSIIDAEHVLLAAHCVPSGEIVVNTTVASPFLVVTGTTAFLNGDGLGNITTASRSATHPSVTAVELGPFPVSLLDIAILRLDTPLVLDGVRQRAIRYARTDALSRPGQVVHDFGWGVFTDSGSIPFYLQTYSPTIGEDEPPGGSLYPASSAESAASAQNTFRYFLLHDSAHPNTSACFGDSGSGVVVFQDNDDDPYYDAYYSGYGTGYYDTDGDNDRKEPTLVGVISHLKSFETACSHGFIYAADVAQAAEWLDARFSIVYDDVYPRPRRPLPYSNAHSGHIARTSGGVDAAAPLTDTFVVTSDRDGTEFLLETRTVEYTPGCSDDEPPATTRPALRGEARRPFGQNSGVVLWVFVIFVTLTFLVIALSWSGVNSRVKYY